MVNALGCALGVSVQPSDHFNDACFPVNISLCRKLFAVKAPGTGQYHAGPDRFVCFLFNYVLLAVSFTPESQWKENESYLNYQD